MPDWLYILLRLLAVLAMAYGAYVGIRRIRAERRRMTPADWLSLSLALPLFGGGSILVYGAIADWPVYVTVIVTFLYLVVALYPLAKLYRWLEPRRSHKGRADAESAGTS